MSLRNKPLESPELTALAEKIETLTTEVAALRGEKKSLASLRNLEDERADLHRKVETLKIEKDRLVEDNARTVREVEHSTGLLRKQVDWERTKAVDEAKLAVGKENLAADRTRFEEQMAFHKDQISGEVARFEGLLKSLLERLPTVSVDKTVTDRPAPVATRK